MNKIAIILIFTFFFTSCMKKATDFNIDYVGRWYLFNKIPTESFTIENNSYGQYFNMGNFGSQEDDIHYDGIVRCDENKLKIGTWHKFTVNVPPHKIDTSSLNWAYGEKPNWSMQINGTTFYTLK